MLVRPKAADREAAVKQGGNAALSPLSNGQGRFIFLRRCWSMSQPIIELKGLTKRFEGADTVLALENIDLTV